MFVVLGADGKDRSYLKKGWDSSSQSLVHHLEQFSSDLFLQGSVSKRTCYQFNSVVNTKTEQWVKKIGHCGKLGKNPSRAAPVLWSTPLWNCLHGVLPGKEVALVSSSKFLKEILEKLFSVSIKRHQNIGVKFLGSDMEPAAWGCYSDGVPCSRCCPWSVVFSCIFMCFSNITPLNLKFSTLNFTHGQRSKGSINGISISLAKIVKQAPIPTTVCEWNTKRKMSVFWVISDWLLVGLSKPVVNYLAAPA